MKRAVSAEELRVMLEETASGLGVRRLTLGEESLREYCGLTGHDFERYRSRGVAPAGFVMTFLDPIVSELMLKFFVARPGVIKGVIHTHSMIELAGPLMPGEYDEELTVGKVEAKSGSKGDYVVVDFEVVLRDSASRPVATDVHQFFLRV